MRLHFFYLFSFFFAFLPQAAATHIVGGEITYECFGGNVYNVTLTVYRDCYNGWPAFDDPAIVGIYETQSGMLFKKLLLNYDESTNDTLPIVLNNPCLVAPPNVCVHKAVYRSTVVLPFVPQGYTVVYQRCCRNRLIRNIPDPLNTGISFVAQISEQALLGCNNAATFTNWPPVAVCVHQPIDFDHSAFDSDGDSLVYRLCTPYLGPDSLNSIPNPPVGPPYEELTWLDPPYNLNNLLGGQPLSIDSLTGFMTGIPNTVGNFVVGVCVDEYRSDTLLSTTRRDFQYNVADCGSATAAFFVPETICDTLQVHFLNESTFALYFRWYFDWPGNLLATSLDYSPYYTYPDTGTYQIALIAEPNTACSDTFVFDLHLVYTEGVLSVSADPEEIDRGGSSQLTAEWQNAVSYAWSPASSLNDAHVSDPLASPLITTSYAVTATLDNGCQRAAEVTVRVNPPVCGPPFVFLPTGFSPNGDGENDVLKLESNIVTEAYWAIFNRWGEKVFEANSLEDTWDGTYRGTPQPVETYGYYLRVRCEDGQEWISQGNVTLLR
ncbi:MAG: gliding motility-associated C-terminal domain-containing protein [Saprospiraceae bacterium]|nr:gliding motility-associated C-terminal domain-containing protein [Saprospiraceae bacterium]